MFESSTILYGSNVDTIPVEIESVANINLFIDVDTPTTFTAKVTNSTHFETHGGGFIWTVTD
ncbi:hypothetical protein COB52_05695 [Candidatus Kaiserbacteria bacterium]|nr:MAG: hypothetical protein COB52_05695 [Candidatus Kaiserbacteria bacterium]